MVETKNPKVFISYCWTNQEYQDRIVQFVDRLRESGVETIFDKYDLEPGADKYDFMEKSVKDPSVSKVLIFCNKEYSERADGRNGGVGTETQIISPQVYEDLEPGGKNKKFIPIIMERDETGKEYVPAYLKGKIYYDFSRDEQNSSDNWERLLRYLYGKPEYRAKELGKPPSFIISGNAPNFGTSSKHDFAISALKNDKNTALASCNDFFDSVYGALDGLILDFDNDDGKMLNAVYDKIQEMLPLRNDCLDVISAMITYKTAPETISAIHSFLEKLLEYKNAMKNKEGVRYPWQADHFKFFSHEVFLYVVTFMIKARRFDLLKPLLSNYLISNDYNPTLNNFCIFWDTGEFPRHYQKEHGLERRTSIVADWIKERCNYGRIKFHDLMQTDLFLCVCDKVVVKSDDYHNWPPILLIYRNEYSEGVFELFMRATSKEFFNNTFGRLGITKDNFTELKTYFQNNPISFGWFPIPTATLINADNIATSG